MAYESATHDGFTVESSSETADQIRESFANDVAASDLIETPTPEHPEDADAAADAKADAKIGKPRNDPKARVEAATAKEAAAKRERDEAKAENARLAARLAELEARSAPKPAPRVEAAPKADVEPTVDQFDTYEKYVDARARWAARQEWDSRERVRNEQQADHQFAKSVEQVDNKFFEKYAAAIQEDPDFAGRIKPSLLTTMRLGAIPLKVRTAPDFAPTLGNIVMEEVFQADHPKPMLLHLSDPDVAQRLATLPPDQVRRELVRFDKSQGAASPAAPAPVAPVSHAKAPIRPVGSSPVAVSDVPDDDASIEKHIAYYNGLDRKSGRR